MKSLGFPMGVYVNNNRIFPNNYSNNHFFVLMQGRVNYGAKIKLMKLKGFYKWFTVLIFGGALNWNLEFSHEGVI